MRAAIDETQRRRGIQEAYNRKHGIVPETIKKSIRAGIETDASKHRKTEAAAKADSDGAYITIEYVDALEQEMLAAAENLEFERAATIRDRVLQLKDHIGKPLAEIEVGNSDMGGKARGRKKQASSPHEDIK